MKMLCTLLAALCATLILRPGPALSQDENAKMPWAVLPRAQALDDSQKKALLEILRSQPNHGACKKGLLDCLLKEKPDRVAVRTANFAAFLFSKGVPPQGLGEFFKRRADFDESTEHRAFNETDAPIYGNEKAPITLTEFGEFKCTMCASMSPILKSLVDESNGSVRLRFKHFPITRHEGTMLASRAAVAAQRQGKFWEMTRLLYQNINRRDEEHVLELASFLDLDMERFKADLADPEVTKIIRADKVEGVAAKVDATPTIFIDGKLYELRMDVPHLQDTINDEAERLGIAPPYKDWVY